MVPVVRGAGLAGMLVLLTGTACLRVPSDERVLREEFSIPRAAALVALEASPESPGWFGREGLDIRAEFRFEDAAFREYRRDIEADPNWEELPAPDALVAKMFGLATHRRSLEITYQARGEELPEPGSVHNPTDAQLLERWREQLPLEVKNGRYSCRTAGNDIMRSKRVPCSERSGELNDFMFAVLDLDTRVLTVRVNTGY